MLFGHDVVLPIDNPIKKRIEIEIMPHLEVDLCQNLGDKEAKRNLDDIS